MSPNNAAIQTAPCSIELHEWLTWAAASRAPVVRVTGSDVDVFVPQRMGETGVEAPSKPQARGL